LTSDILRTLYVLCVDCAENDFTDWIEIPASSDVNDAVELGRDITVPPASAECMPDDVSGHAAAWQKSHTTKTDRRMTYPACNPHSAVSGNRQLNLLPHY